MPMLRGGPRIRTASTNQSDAQSREADKNSAKVGHNHCVTALRDIRLIHQKIESPKQSEAPVAKQKKTQAELDEEMRQKLEDFSGEGGAAGMEFENGKAVSMKRGVKDNMFRYI